MEATIVYWGYIGIMENKMEATIVYPICKVSLQSVSIQGRDCGTCHI